MTVEEARDRIAKVMGWDRKGVDSFSLPTLRDFVRGKDEELDRALQDIIDQGQHLVVREKR